VSQFLPERPEEKAKTPARGPDAYLSLQERAFLSRMLDHPEELPDKFKAWLLDYVAVNIPMIPISQIQGFTGFTAKSADPVLAIESTTATTYGDLATVGPTLTGIGDGEYIILFGCKANGGTTGGGAIIFGRMALEINGTAAADNDSCQSDSDRGIAGMSIMRAVVKTLDNGGNNTITAKYRSTDSSVSCSFGNRWLTALKVGN